MLKCIAKRPVPERKIYLKYGFVVTEHENHLCPRCRNVLNAGPDYQPNYCGRCGQKISFAGTEWKDEKMLGYYKQSETSH